MMGPSGEQPGKRSGTSLVCARPSLFYGGRQGPNALQCPNVSHLVTTVGSTETTQSHLNEAQREEHSANEKKHAVRQLHLHQMSCK